jgi:transcriptional regulator with XRE-family HTH domain
MSEAEVQAEKRGWFDAEAFQSALDAVRSAKGLNWKDVAAQSGVSASTLTRMAQGKRPDVDGLAALVAWSGLDADDYVRTLGDNEKPEAEPLAKIATYLRSDKNLSPESAKAIEQMVRAAYDSMREKA